MATKFDRPLTQQASNIYRKLIEGNFTELDAAHISNTISGVKPMTILSYNINDESVKLLQSLIKINKELKITNVYLPFGGQASSVLIFKDNGDDIIRKIFNFGRSCMDLGAINNNADPASSPGMNIYHILLGRTLGYDDGEISNFIKKSIQAAIADFKKWAITEANQK